MPNYVEVQDEATKRVLKQLIENLSSISRNAFDDLTRIVPEVIAALPTASAEYYQRIVLKTNAGEDTAHICIHNSSTGAYSWKQISLV
jgi:hypothetical protein